MEMVTNVVHHSVQQKFKIFWIMAYATSQRPEQRMVLLYHVLRKLYSGTTAELLTSMGADDGWVCWILSLRRGALGGRSSLML
jgi:hypothetical protein